MNERGAAGVPVYQEYMNPILAVLRREGRPLTIEQLDRHVIAEMKLGPEVATIPHDVEKPDRSEVSYRIAWSRTYLKKAGFFDNPTRGQWGVSEKGRSARGDRRVRVGLGDRPGVEGGLCREGCRRSVLGERRRR